MAGTHAAKGFIHAGSLTKLATKGKAVIRGRRGPILVVYQDGQISPKGLRHGFGVAAVQAGIPLNMVQKWLGHAQLSTTAIYADAVGAEEQDIAARMWGSS